MNIHAKDILKSISEQYNTNKVIVKLKRLPPELIIKINEYRSDQYLYYQYQQYSWVDIENNLVDLFYNSTVEDNIKLLEYLDETNISYFNPSLSLKDYNIFSPDSWFYMDYYTFKQYSRRKHWFWNDDAADYDKIAKEIIEEVLKKYYDWYCNNYKATIEEVLILNRINYIYELIMTIKLKDDEDEDDDDSVEL